MAKKPEKATRNERLAVSLRENLRRRKAQARTQEQNNSTGQNGSAGLSKTHPKS